MKKTNNDKTHLRKQTGIIMCNREIKGWLLNLRDRQQISSTEMLKAHSRDFWSWMYWIMSAFVITFLTYWKEGEPLRGNLPGV
jgi:hypothetical protein